MTTTNICSDFGGFSCGPPQPKDDEFMQLKELLTNDMLIALFPSLHKLATICLSIPFSTASVERSFSDMKLIMNRLCNRLTELSMSN